MLLLCQRWAAGRLGVEVYSAGRQRGLRQRQRCRCLPLGVLVAVQQGLPQLMQARRGLRRAWKDLGNA